VNTSVATRFDAYRSDERATDSSAHPRRQDRPRRCAHSTCCRRTALTIFCCYLPHHFDFEVVLREQLLQLLFSLSSNLSFLASATSMSPYFLRHEPSEIRQAGHPPSSGGGIVLRRR
jgi:hypothetical protein